MVSTEKKISKLKGKKNFLSNLLKSKYFPTLLARENTRCNYTKNPDSCLEGANEEYNFWNKRKQASTSQIEKRKIEVQKEIKKLKEK